MSKVPYWDEELSQYIIDAAASVEETIIKQFNAEEKHILNNINGATLEQKLLILGKLGKRFAIVVADRGRVSTRTLNVKSISQFFKDRLLKLAGPALKNWGMFVRADKELMQNLSRLSLDINPQTMYLLRNYDDIAQHIDNVSHLEVKVAVEHQSHLLIDRLMQEAYGFLARYDSFDYRRYLVSKEEIPVFFYLSYNRRRYVSVSELCIYLGLKPSLVQKYLQALVHTGHVQEDIAEFEGKPGNRSKVYQLTGYGVTIVNKMRERITAFT